MTADYTQVGEESPREACANLAMTFRDFTVAFDGSQLLTPILIHPTHFRNWASRLERAVQQLDAAQSPPEGPWRFVGQVTEGGDWHIEHELTHDCMSFWCERDAHAVADALNRVAVPPAEQDTPQ